MIMYQKGLNNGFIISFFVVFNHISWVKEMTFHRRKNLRKIELLGKIRVKIYHNNINYFFFISFDLFFHFCIGIICVGNFFNFDNEIFSY